jgi:hypothetical protein
VTRLRLFALVAPLLAVTAEGASLTLDARRLQEAVEVGERSVTRDSLGDEWDVRNPAGHQVTVMTPFRRVALAARQAAFRRDTLKPRDRDRAVKEQQDRLVFWVELKGSREDFARFYTPRLVAGARQIEPSFAQNERTAARTEDGKFVARCVYGFPTRLVPAAGKVVLLIRDADGRDLTSFAIDLGSMR